MTITAKVGGPIGPHITVKVKSDGTVTPTNPVIIGPTAYFNEVIDIDNKINIAAGQAYANAIADDIVDDSVIDCGEF